MNAETIVKGILTVGILILAVPFLVIEPTLISETFALAAIGALWGYDLEGLA